MAEWNCDFPEDLFYAWGGFPVAEIISRLNEDRGLKMPIAEVARRNSILMGCRSWKAAPEVLEHIDSFTSHAAVAGKV